MGLYNEAHEQITKTIELEPSWAIAHVRLGENYLRQGLYSEAIPHLERAQTLEDWGLGSLGYAYAKSGRIEDARGVLESMDTRYVTPLERAAVYAGLGEVDALFESLDQAYDERVGGLALLRAAPWTKDVEQDPRFAELMRRVGLEE